MIKVRIKYETCPLCRSVNYEESLVGDCSKHPLYKAEIPTLMQWMDCNDCHHQFVSGYFTDDALKLVFLETHEHQKVGYEIEKNRHVSARMIEKVIQYRDSGTWLDVGFGNGSLLFTAQEYGFEAVGVDLRKANVEALRQESIEAYCDLVEKINFKNKLSVVSMMDVLEHIPYPKEVLKDLCSKMVDGGCAVISMPNTENICWRLMTKQNVNPYLGEIEHYHNFSRTRIFSLLKECGLEPVRYGVSERYRICMEVIAIKK